MKNPKFIIAFIIFLILLGGAGVIWFERRASVVMNKQVMAPTTAPLPTTISKTISLGQIDPTSPTSTPVPNEGNPGSLSAKVMSSTIKVSQPFTVDLRMAAPGKVVIGSDVILKYDANLLRADTITEAGTFAMYARKDINNTKGLVSITAFRLKETTPLVSDLSIATVTFTPLKVGNSQIIIDYVPGSTNHSTIVESKTSKNILGNAMPLTVMVEK